MFLQVDTVVRDSQDDFYVVRSQHIKTEEISDFRPWHKGKDAASYQCIDGGMTVVYMQRHIEDGMENKKWFIIINEKESDFRDRLNSLSVTACPTNQAM